MNKKDPEFNRKFNEAVAEWEKRPDRSSLNFPQFGEIEVPLCKRCKKAEFHYGTRKWPGCKAYGEIPEKLYNCESYECEHYDPDPVEVERYKAFDMKPPE